MNTAAGQVMRESMPPQPASGALPAPPHSGSGSRPGQISGHLVALLCCALLAPALVYWPTFWSMGEIWWRSETYAHGFFVLPVALYIAYAQRARLTGLEPERSRLGLIALACCGLGWLVASIAGVQAGEQLMAVLMIPALVLALSGPRIARVLAFPLLFLLFAVPFGESFIPAMMEFTASFTVFMLRLTGVPVYREGLFFSVPTGEWSVVAECSGIRYLIASLMLGTLFAYMTYTKPWKRVGFVALSAIVPVFANGMRAYLIVMIAHLSDMRLALGVDHFIYGWVWFGVVIMLLYWLGNVFRDPPRLPGVTGSVAAVTPAPAPRLGTFAAALAVLLFWPYWSATVEAVARDHGGDWPRPELPTDAGTWARTSPALTEWHPLFQNPVAELHASYARGADRVGLHAAYYPYSRQGSELVNSQNRLIALDLDTRRTHPEWRLLGTHRRSTGIAAPALVEEAVVDAPWQRLLVWRWYFVGGRHVSSDVLAKALEVQRRLVGADTRGFGLVLYTGMERSEEDEAEARARLARFMTEARPFLEQALLVGDRPETSARPPAEGQL